LNLCAALCLLALEEQDFTAADLPDELTQDDIHLPGIAVGKLIQAGVLQVVGRTKSPDKKAHGRKLDVLRMTSRQLCVSWLARNGFSSAIPYPKGEPVLL